nr:Unknown Function [uncultured bacterium]
MSRFGKTLFGGSRFIFWSLAPILIFCAAVLPLLVTRWTAATFFWVTLIESLLVSLTLGLFNPRRFRWALRCATGIVFGAFLAYAVDEIFLSGKSLEAGSGNRAEVSPRNAIMGLLIIGLPCLWYTLFGRFSLRNRSGPDGSAHEVSDKVDAIDIDI